MKLLNEMAPENPGRREGLTSDMARATRDDEATRARDEAPPQAAPAPPRGDTPAEAAPAPPRGDTPAEAAPAPARDDTPAEAAPAPARDEAAVSRFVEDFALALVEMGVPRMPARVFAAVLTSDSGRLTAAELAATLRASPAAVSGAVRYLIQLGMVRREGEPGSRRHYYRAPDNVWGEVIGIRDHLMARWTGVLREGVHVLGAGTPAGARVAESARFFEFVSSELPLVIARWQESRGALDGQAGQGR
jgi:predicted transcriptional regulator